MTLFRFYLALTAVGFLGLLICYWIDPYVPSSLDIVMSAFGGLFGGILGVVTSHATIYAFDRTRSWFKHARTRALSPKVRA